MDEVTAEMIERALDQMTKEPWLEPFRNRLAVGGLNQSTAPCLL